MNRLYAEPLNNTAVPLGTEYLQLIDLSIIFNSIDVIRSFEKR